MTRKVSCVQCHEDLWNAAKKDNKVKENARLGVVVQQIDSYMKSIHARPSMADQSRTIRIPVHMVETIAKYKQVVRRLSQDLGRDPLPEEIATEMGVDVEKIHIINNINQDTVSLEKPIGDDGDEKSTLGEFIAGR